MICARCTYSAEDIPRVPLFNILVFSVTNIHRFSYSEGITKAFLFTLINLSQEFRGHLSQSIIQLHLGFRLYGMIYPSTSLPKHTFHGIVYLQLSYLFGNSPRCTISSFYKHLPLNSLDRINTDYWTSQIFGNLN